MLTKWIVLSLIAISMACVFGMCMEQCEAQEVDTTEQLFFLPVWTYSMHGMPIITIQDFETLEEALGYCREMGAEECPVFKIKYVECDYKANKTPPLAPDGVF